MSLQIENSISDIADRVRDRYEDVLRGARRRTETAADRLSKGKKPVRSISRLGVRISGVSHRTTNKLWKQQTKLLEKQIDAVAGRLEAAVGAEDLRDLLETQIRLFPEGTARFADEAREALKLIKGAGGEIRELVKDAVAELKGQKPVAGKATARKAPAGKTAKAEAVIVDTAGSEEAA